MPASTVATATATLAALKVLLALVDKHADLIATDEHPDVINAACDQATAAITDAELELAGQPHPACLREALVKIEEHCRHPTPNVHWIYTVAHDTLAAANAGELYLPEHTPGPWAWNGLLQVSMAHPLSKQAPIANVVVDGVSFECAKANAARIVDCVNYCEGLPSSVLKRGRAGSPLKAAA